MLIYKFNEKLVPATFVRRINKFLVEVNIERKIEECHLHDPGRLEKLLKSNRKLLLLRKEGKRKTKYDVIAVFKNEWVLIHSGYHSMLAEQILKNKLMDELKEYSIIRKEFKYGKSRIDFLLSNAKKCLVEVKGCTLVEKNIALFPDAPTKRGTKHVLELVKARRHGYNAAIIFLIMLSAKSFSPNSKIDKDFSQAMEKARDAGVKIIACRIKFDGRNIYYGGRIPVSIAPSRL